MAWTVTEVFPDGATDHYWYGAAVNNTGTRFAACKYDNGLYISHDSGATWTRVYPSGSYSSFTDVKMDSAGVYMVTGMYQPPAFPGNRGIYMSSNGGLTWARTNSNLSPAAVCISADGRIVAACYLEKVYISHDYGNSWIERSPSIGMDNYLNTSFTGISCNSDGSILIAIAYDDHALIPIPTGLFISTNYGYSWYRLRYTGLPAISGSFRTVSCFNNGNMFMVTGDVDGINRYPAFSSVNGGITWTAYGNLFDYRNYDENDNKTVYIKGYNIGEFGGAYGGRLYIATNPVPGYPVVYSNLKSAWYN